MNPRSQVMLAGDEAMRAAGAAPRHVDEHRRMLDLIQAGDADGAARLMGEHLRAALTNLSSARPPRDGATVGA